MKITVEIFTRVYDRISTSLQEIDIKSIRTSGGKIMDLFLGVPSFKAFIDDGKNMISLLKDFRTGEYRDISWATVAAILFSFIYMVAPYDLIPDFIPFIGMVDDLFIFRIALAFIQDDLEQYVDWKRNAHIEDAEIIDEPVETE